MATSQSDYPTDSNTKSEIKDFYDIRNVDYNSSDTKAELLSKIRINDFTGSKNMRK